MSQLDMRFETLEGFSRPDWKALHAFVKQNVQKDDWGAAWTFIAQKWLEQLATDLGGGARVHRSRNFLCLSDLGSERTLSLLAYAESVILVIRQALREAAWTGFHGKHVLLIFSDPDDYFAYVSYYYREGRHPQSGGVFITRGYAHIAFPHSNPRSAEHTLVHELVHNLLCHLPIPAWLNEGLAVLIERRVARYPFLLDKDLVERHYQHWNASNIQSFWAGESFHVPGEDHKLSYSLSEILVNLLSEKGPDFITFIKNADWRDAGLDAALNILDRDLGAVASEFLGPGNWRPQRKAISEFFKKKPA